MQIEKARKALEGLYIGDCFALPYEGLSSRQISVLSPELLRSPWLHRGWFYSDDSEHALFTFNSLIDCKDSPQFKSRLKNQLRLWMLSLPIGGGLGTLKAGLLHLLFFPHRGIRSQGNGPMMRAPIIGAAFCEEEKKRNEFVKISTELTHSDPVSLEAAQWVAMISANCAKNPQVPVEWHLYDAANLLTHESLKKAYKKGWDAYEKRLPLQLRKPGWCVDSIAALTYCLLMSKGSLAIALKTAIDIGGDTDTHAAILSSWCTFLDQENTLSFPRKTPPVTTNLFLLLPIHLFQFIIYLDWMVRRRLPFKLGL
jgi:ADP-ribosylglycohydrolase